MIPQEEKELRSRIVRAHGLAKLSTLRQEAAMEVRMLGMKGPSLSSRVVFDFQNQRGRVEFIENGKINQIYQETKEGRFFWTAKAGKTSLGPATLPFDFVPLMQTSLVGIIALGVTQNPLQFRLSDALGKRKGSSLTRTQPARLMPMMQGRAEPRVEACECTWTYLADADGTLLAERLVQTNTSKKRLEQELSYERFELISGVKVPVELGVKNNQLPKLASAKIKVRQTEINPPLSLTDFTLPS